MGQVEGFDAGEKTIPAPLVQVADGTRERLIRLLAAVVCGSTPETVAGYLEEDEFPDVVSEMLGRPGEREELGAHVDLLLGVLQAPAGATS
jgi:hypothetical protein